MNYEPVSAVNQTNDDAGLKSSDDEFVDDARKKNAQYLEKVGDKNGYEKDVRNQEEALRKQFDQATERLVGQGEATITNSTNKLNIVSPSVSAYDDEDVGAEADLNNLETTMNVSPIPTTRIHKDHPKDQIIGDINSAIQTRRIINFSEENAMVSYISKQRRTNHKDYQNCLFACFLSQIEPKKVNQALTDPSWIEAMQEELLQFKLQKVWTLVDLPKGKRAIGTKWVCRNKKDEKGIIVRNKARLVAQGYTQEEGIDYDEVFAPVARIEAIRLFLAYASFMRFIVYQMDVKSAFLYSTIEEEVYVCQPPGFEDPQFPDKVYKVEKTLYGLHQAPRACTPIKTNKALVKDEEAEAIDVHLYRSMIGSLMYLTSSRPDIMFDVCACARFQVTPKTSHIHDVERIFRYLKGQPKLGLWYPRDSPFDLEAFSVSDYARASLDMKSTTRGCQFLGKKLISWQCKKKTIVANSTTEEEYVAAANCCGQFWDTATSKTVNSVKQIHAIVDGNAVVISESSMRNDLLFNDENAHTDYPSEGSYTKWNMVPISSPQLQGQNQGFCIPRTAEEILARERERKARTTLLMALPEDHLAKFHKMTDAKEMWEAIKSRFGGNDESKKIQKYILKQQFEGFSVSNSEGLTLKGLYPGFSVFYVNYDSWLQGSPPEVARSEKFIGVAMISNKMEKFTKGQVESYNLMPRNQLVLIKPKSSVIIVTRQGILLDSAEQREIKIVRRKMLGTLAIRIKRMGEDLIDEDYALMGLQQFRVSIEMSANDKFGLGYGDFRYDGILSYENEVLQSVFMNKESDLENQHLVIIDSEDEHVSLPTEEQETPSFANQQVKTPRETVKNQFTHRLRTNFSKQKVNTAEVNAVTAVRGKRETADYPHGTLQQRIVDSGCSGTRLEWKQGITLLNIKTLNGGLLVLEEVKDYCTANMVCLYFNSQESKEIMQVMNIPNFSNTSKCKEDQVFLDELERLKGKNMMTKDAAKLSGRILLKETADIALYKQELLKLAVLTQKYMPREKFINNPTDGYFYQFILCDEGAVADFTNLEPVVNVSPIPTSRINSIHPSTLWRSTISSSNKKQSDQEFLEPMLLNISEALKEESWVDALLEELLQFQIRKFWVSWTIEEEGIDYDEVFALVARIEAIRIFLAFASYMGFIIYQMDVKSAFLYGKIDEEVYASQPSGFIDPKCPKKVYKVVKALYGLHQAPRVWYATLSTFLLKNGYKRGTIDKTLFIKKDKHDIILVQVYVDEIIFGSTKKSLCDEFEALMKSRFQMSSIGELTFFLRLQVKQKEDGIFISQDRYVAEILKKFDFVSVKTASTPIETQKPLVKDEEASDVDSVLVLKSCPKHNMVTYLEKTNGNIEFHEIINFLTRSSIHYALTVSPVVFTTFVEQFWMSAKSKLINNVRYITAKVAGKPVSISEASIRSDLLFNDADGIDSLPNQAIFDAIQLMGHFDAKKKFVMYPRFISVFLDKHLKNVPVPLDHFPINALTSKVFSFMVKKGKHFSGKVTPLFPNMLVQPTEDEGGICYRNKPRKLTLAGKIKKLKGERMAKKPGNHIPQSLDEECIYEAKIGRKEILKDTVDAKGVCIQTGEEICQS
ncbi:putative ribonuclease H-like domain-containing protein [Tanacetum coccineum]